MAKLKVTLTRSLIGRPDTQENREGFGAEKIKFMLRVAGSSDHPRSDP